MAGPRTTASVTRINRSGAEQGSIELTIRASSRSALNATFRGLVALASKSVDVADASMVYGKTPAPDAGKITSTSVRRGSTPYVVFPNPARVK